ncbi:MAG: PEP-CTERM sorting domain-containing protein [Burkholderiaceae bacterium]
MSSRLMRAAARMAAAVALAACALPHAGAAFVQADLSRVGGNTWDASFTVGADPGQTIESFTIYFDWTQVSNLQVWATPGDWDSLVVQADGALASDGYYDALALADGITDPKVLGGFIARFEWADPDGPGALRFTVNDPTTFAVVEEGAVDLRTGGGAGVPEPGTGTLIMAALVATVTCRRRCVLDLSTAA